MNLEVGKTYEFAVNGQLWSFVVKSIDELENDLVFVTWHTGEEEWLYKKELITGVEEADILRIAGVIYPKGKTEKDIIQALDSIILNPTCSIIGQTVPRTLVLINDFFSDYPIGKEDYFSFTYDSDTKLLTAASSLQNIDLPDWITSRFNVVGIMRFNKPGREKKSVFQIHLDLSKSHLK